MSSNIARFEFEILNDFQKDLHLIFDENELPEEGVEIISFFHHKFEKSTWYSQYTTKFKCTSTENELIYTVNNTFHYLLYSYMRQTFPALRVAERYKGLVQICWPHNLGTNYIVEGRLKFDDDVPQTIDSYWFDIYSQFYMKPGFREHYELCVGSVPFLEQWRDFLPEFTTNVMQPFYYMRDVSTALPLFYFSSLTTITQNYTVRNTIGQLLRMRINTIPDQPDNPVWKEIPYNPKYIEGAGSTGILRVPEMWGRVSYGMEMEINWHKECSFEGVENLDPKKPANEKVFYIEDVIACESDNPSQYGAKVVIDLDCKTPAKAMFWVAENLTARENRNFSNYTTNADDLYQGWNPIKGVSLSYGGHTRLDNMESDHFDKIEPWKHFPSAPWQPGYNAYSFSLDSTTLDADVGIVWDGLKAKMTATLGNTDPTLKPVKRTDEHRAVLDELENDNKVQSSSDRFQIHVRLLVTKKMIVRKLGPDRFEVKV